MYNDITDKNQSFVEGFYRPLNDFLADLRKDGEERDIPIIRKDTEMVLRSILALKNPRRILEIGTAHGYSALFFAFACKQAKVTTLEISAKSVKQAQKNIACAETFQAGISEQITVLEGDAALSLATLQNQGDKETPENTAAFDMVFLDGPKGQYKAHLELLLPLLTDDPLIVSDNILLGGMASGEEKTVRRNLTMVRRMDEYLRYIMNLTGFETTVIGLTDGLAITWKTNMDDY